MNYWSVFNSARKLWIVFWQPSSFSFCIQKWTGIWIFIGCWTRSVTCCVGWIMNVPQLCTVGRIEICLPTKYCDTVTWLGKYVQGNFIRQPLPRGIIICRNPKIRSSSPTHCGPGVGLWHGQSWLDTCMSSWRIVSLVYMCSINSMPRPTGNSQVIKYGTSLFINCYLRGLDSRLGTPKLSLRLVYPRKTSKKGLTIPLPLS